MLFRKEEMERMGWRKGPTNNMMNKKERASKIKTAWKLIQSIFQMKGKVVIFIWLAETASDRDDDDVTECSVSQPLCNNDSRISPLLNLSSERDVSFGQLQFQRYSCLIHPSSRDPDKEVHLWLTCLSRPIRSSSSSSQRLVIMQRPAQLKSGVKLWKHFPKFLGESKLGGREGIVLREENSACYVCWEQFLPSSSYGYWIQWWRTHRCWHPRHEDGSGPQDFRDEENI